MLSLVALCTLINQRMVFAQQDHPDVRIFQSSSQQTETSIAINPTNPKNILVCWNETASGTHAAYFYTLDGGRNWAGSETSPAGVLAHGDPVAGCYSF